MTIQDTIEKLESERAEKILELREAINPATGKLWTLDEIARELGFKSKQACFYHAKKARKG